MTSLLLLEKIARKLVDTIQVNEKNSFPAPLMDYLVDGAVKLKMDVGMMIMDDEAGRQRSRRLFRDVSLDEIANDFEKNWGEDFTGWVAQPPMISTVEDTNGWRRRPDFARLTERLKGIDLVMHTRKVPSDAGDYMMVVIAPKFPEWYVYARGEHCLADDKRLGMLENMPGMIDAFMNPQGRVGEGEAGPFFALMLEHVFPQIMEASETVDAVRKVHAGFLGFYQLCGLPITKETIGELPDFYKELGVFFLDSVFETSNVPVLKSMIKQHAQG
jgi:hypothetical protein